MKCNSREKEWLKVEVNHIFYRVFQPEIRLSANYVFL